MTNKINELNVTTTSNHVTLSQFCKENTIRSQKNIESLKSQIEDAELELNKLIAALPPGLKFNTSGTPNAVPLKSVTEIQEEMRILSEEIDKWHNTVKF